MSVKRPSREARWFRFLPRPNPVFPAVLCLAVSHLGCHLPGYSQQRAEAERDWERLRAEYKLRLAKGQLKQGDVREATASLQKAAAIDPTNPTYHRLLAKCHLETRSVEAARDAIKQAKELGDTSAALAYTQGMLAEEQSKFETALGYYREAAKLEPENVDHCLAIAECLVSLGREAEAKAFLDERLRAREAEQLTLLRAQIHLLLGNLEAAAADFETAEDLLVDTPWLAEEFGLVLVRLGHYAKGVAVLRPLVESAGQSSEKESSALPVSPAAVRALATCYNRTDTPAKAKRLVEDYLRRSPGDGRGWWVLAESSIRLED